MASVIGGYDTGLLDGSLYLLNRDDKTREGNAGHNEQVYVNIANGNLLVRHTDAYLPSQGEDYAVVRTYNSRGNWNEGVGEGWTITTSIDLTQITSNAITLMDADGSYFEFTYDDASGQYISVDGDGAYQTISYDKPAKTYTLVRPNQTRLLFDNNGTLTQSIDTNGNTITYLYKASKLVQVLDDTGHSITYEYGGSQGTELTRIIDSDVGVLVEYTYDKGLLTTVTDRNGDVTTYTYDTDSHLNAIYLPHDASIAADEGKERVIRFEYDPVMVDNTGKSQLLSTIWDAEGNPTRFDYEFYRDNHTVYNGSRAQMVNALGIWRSESNEAEYVQWRLENGYYASWDELSYNEGLFKDASGEYVFDQVQWDAYKGQVDEIQANHSTWFYTDENSQVTQVGTSKESNGAVVYEYATYYEYDDHENLTAIVDANAFALQYSDDTYWRDMRAQFGYVDALTGQGLLTSQLSDSQKAELAEHFTTHLTYDEHGNMLSRVDNEDNLTTFTYTDFNKLATQTSAMGHALVSSNEAFYQDKRVELGFSADVADLSSADLEALLSLYTTTYTYDANQNLIEIRTPGGDLTTFTYDQYGNVTERTVYQDQSDLVDPSKQQITQYFYDAYGNNVKTIEGNAWAITHSNEAYWVAMRQEFGITDASGDGKQVADLSSADIDVLNAHYTSYSTFDLFGNQTQFIDANSGVTNYVYDADNRLISITTPEGNTTVYSYDSVGNRIGVTDANGHSVVYVYDRNNMLIAVQDWKTAAGTGEDDRTTHYSYDVVGNRTSTIDANGVEIVYVYREDNRLLELVSPEVEDVEGNSVRYSTYYSFDAVGNLIREIDNNGNITDFVYNQNHLIKQTTDPLGHVTQYQYDANLNQVQIVIGAQLAESARRVLKYSYDEENQLIAELDAEGNKTQYGYDASGNRVQVIDALGREYVFEYDAQNRLIIETQPAVIDPLSGMPVNYTVVHYFDGNGNELATTDQNGNSTKVSYDKDNRAVLIEDANGIKSSFTYDGNNNRTGVYIGVEAHLDADGHVVLDNVDQAQITTYRYDEFNQVISKTDGLGNALAESDDTLYRQMRAELGYVDAQGDGKLVADLSALEKAELKALYTERYRYDNNGNLLQVTDNAGRISSFAYDAMNRQVSATDALGNTATSAYDGNSNQLSFIDAMGRVTTFSYDGNDRLIDNTDANGVVTHREYDAFGNVRFETQAYGTLEARTTEYRYDLNNRVTEVIDPQGHPIQYEYDAVGNRVRVTDAKGGQTQFVFDALNRNIKIIDPLNFETQYEFDGVGNTIALIDANGGISRLEYDPGNRLISTTDAEGRTVGYSYDVRGNRISSVDGNGNTTVFEYDAQNNLRAVIDGEGNRTEQDYDRVYNLITTTDGNGHTTSYAFDALNRQISVTDALGHSSYFAYDAVGNQVSSTDALGRVSTYTYDDVNRLIVATAADGVQTQYSYDAVANRTAITYAANTAEAATTTFLYNKDNQLIAQTDALGNTTTYAYDANHNQTVVTDANGHATTYDYDANDQVVKITDAEGHITRYSYDGNGNRVQVIDARGNAQTTYYNANNEISFSVDARGYATSYVYDNNGNVVSRTVHMQAIVGTVDPSVVPSLPSSAADQTTVYDYDANNRLVATHDGEGYTTTRSYDAVGNVLIRTDANGHSAAYSYDDVNRLVATTDALGGVSSYTYDAVGNRISKTDANGHSTAYSYDSVNRLIAEHDAQGNTIAYAFDARGNRTSVTDALGHTTTYAYNSINRLVSQTDALGGLTSYVYDAVGNRTAITDARGHTTTYTYDADNLLVQVDDALGGVTLYDYDANHNRVSVTDALGNTTTSYYDANNALSISVDALGFATSYRYDGAGNVFDQTLHMQAIAGKVDPSVLPSLPSSADDQSVGFEYDALNRLSAHIDGEGYRTEYVYDGVGNRLETHQQISADGTVYAVSRSSYDALNREVRHESAEGVVTSSAYDAVGNRTAFTDGNGNTTTYLYDEVNRLVGQTSPAGVLTAYQYDANGNRLAVIDAQGSAEERTTTFAYDELNRLTDTVNAHGVVTHYAHDALGNITSRIDAYGLAEARENTYVYDALGRVTQETNALGVVTDYQYDANGKRLSQTIASGVAGVERSLSYVYDANGRLIAEVNGEGERTEYTYDGAGNRISLTEAPGLAEQRSNQFEFDRDNRLVATVDALGTRTEYVYDGAGNKVQTTQAVGLSEERISSYRYDLDNRLVQVSDPQGGVTQYVYDGLGNQIQIIDANGGVQNNRFDVLGQLEQTVSAGGVMTTNAYDARGNIVAMTQSWADGTDTRTTTYAYDLLDQQVAITDPEGFSTTIAYDVFGNQTQIINGQYLIDTQDPSYDPNKAARTHVTSNSFSYDAASQMTSMTDGVGTVTKYSYDAVGNRVQVVETANERPRVTTYSYDLASRQIGSVNPEGGTNLRSYDAVGNLVQERTLQSIDASGVETWVINNFEYNSNGNLIAEIDPYGVRTEHEYDAMGNATSHRYAAGTSDERVVSSEYDFNNRITADIDGEGNRTSYSYDAMGNRISVTDALGRIANYVYDGSNNLVSITDPEGHTTEYVYDAAGNQIEVTLGDRTTAFEFDGANNVITRYEPNGTVKRFEYDAAGNLLSESLYANSLSTSALSVTGFEYDENSRLVRFVDKDGTVTEFSYDAANNKVGESIISDTDINSIRTTEYKYDLNNRQISVVFDPEGLHYEQTLSYDILGNVTYKADANGVGTAYSYDLNNHVISEVRDPDGLNLVSGYTYDAVGNVVAETDPRGYTTDYLYDGNNRQIKIIGPEVSIFTITELDSVDRPTITKMYDAAGNVIQEVDPNGYKVTHYYDGNNRIVAEIDGHNALREYSYNAQGDQTAIKLYMTRLSDAAHDPYTRPAAPSGEVRVTTNVFDGAGQLVQTLHPETEITTLVDAGGDAPVVSAEWVSASETWSYDAFGNQVEYVDKNGNRNLYYYDIAGNMIAHVDGEGYLTQWSYDAQGNALEQTIYTNTLDVDSLDASVYPVAPSGAVYTVTKTYNAASQLIEERTPFFDVYNPLDPDSPNIEQQVTRYSYDANGNVLTKTIAAGTSGEIVEYSYYDANDRLVAVINGARVLHLYSYDANGNTTKQERLFNQVPADVDLGALTGDTDFRALVNADATKDQSKVYVYDALNRMTRETDLMGAGSGDDISRVYKYNRAQLQTWIQDEDGYVTTMAYNGLGLAELTQSPDGSGIISEYDAAGNQISGFTGAIDNNTLPAEVKDVTISDKLAINWDLMGVASMGSRVVYGSSSQAGTDGYKYQTGVINTWNQASGQASLDVSAFESGDTIYFRVITQDLAGNIAYTKEYSVVVPPRVTDVSINQDSNDKLVVSARFDEGALSPVLLYGAVQNTTTAVDFVQQADGSYQATINETGDGQAYRIAWQDANGQIYTSTEQPFEAQGLHLAVSSSIVEGTVSTDAGPGYVMDLHTELPASLGYSMVSAEWRELGATTGYSSTANSGVLDSSGTYYRFDLTMGNSTAALSAGEYEVIIRGVDQATGQSVVLDTLSYTVGQTNPEVLNSYSVSIEAPAIGNSQLVISNGIRLESDRQDEYATFDLIAAGSQNYNVLYSDAFGATHTTTVSSTELTQSVPNPQNPSSVYTVVTGYDLDVSVTLSDEELANIAGPVTLSWRSAADGLEFENSMTMGVTGNTVSSSLKSVDAGQYDLKVSYLDAEGNEVVVDWYRANTAVGSTSFTETSQTLTGWGELGGEISLNANGFMSVDPGLYLGGASATDLASVLQLSKQETGQEGGTRDANGLTTGYFTEIHYNALGQVIAEVGQDGLYKEYAVDANGNRVVTYLYGEKDNNSAITSFSAFDARDRLVTQWDPAFVADGLSAAEHPVTQYVYDFSDNVISQTDALGHTTQTTYNALGMRTSVTDASGATTTYYYDVRGNEVAVTDALGNTARKEYDVNGNLTAEVNGVGNYIRYTYDSFGRKETMTKDLNAATPLSKGDTTSYAYDQRDRLISMTDALGGVTRYAYDNRDNQTWTFDPRWSLTESQYKYGQQYDSMGRVIETITYTNGKQQAVTERQYDYYGNLIVEIDPEGRVKTTSYEGFGRVAENTDEGGTRTVREYDAYGRMVREYDPGGKKDIRYAYDDKGNQTSITDYGTGVSTVYTYDLAGNRISEVISTPNGAHNRSYTYVYDDRGNLIRWDESVTGMHLNYLYDAAGNLKRAHTDLGYDPDGKNVDETPDDNVDDTDPNFRHVNHWYEYDSANRLVRVTDGVNGTIVNEYGYDKAGNRIYMNTSDGVTVNYTYDANGQVLSGTWYTGSGDTLTKHEQKWTYDAVGNVKTYQTYNNSTLDESNTYWYYADNTQYLSQTKDSTTGSTYDLSGRLLTKVINGDGYSIAYYYNYYADGRELSVFANGDSSGASLFAYDSNEKQTVVNIGKGNDQNRAEVSTFVYDNEGHIIYKWHDTGEGSQSEIFGVESDTRKIESIEYVYANGNPVGETGINEDGEHVTKLDTGSYSLVQELSDTNPGTSVTIYTVNEGDTLQSIAGAMYGNPSLWFVIAEANGLTGAERLKAGSQIQVPNNIQTGRLTSEAHAMYSESDIIGSTMPNLEASGGGGGGCAGLLAIVIIVAIAIICPIAVTALVGVMPAALGLAAYAIAGAVVYATANIIQQGLLMAIGVQEEFDWGQVGTAAVSGMFSGLAQGIQVNALDVAKKTGQVSQYAKVAATAMKVASVASKQLMTDGKITSWTGIISAGVGEYLSFSKAAADAAAATATTQEAAKAASEAANNISEIQTIVEYATPWVQLAETYVRNDGELTPQDWAGAIGSTLSTAVTDNSLGADQYQNAINRMGVNLLVAGALSQSVGSEQATEFFYQSVGSEVGQLLGGGIAGMLQGPQDPTAEPKPVFDPERGEYVIAGPDGSYQTLAGSLPSESALPAAMAGAGVAGLVMGQLASAVPTGGIGEVTTQDENKPETYTIGKGDSFWAIAKQQLGEDASDADILAYTQQLMEVNPGLDPRQLKPGQEIILATGNEVVSQETVNAYNESDSEYQDYREIKSKQIQDEKGLKTSDGGGADVSPQNGESEESGDPQVNEDKILAKRSKLKKVTRTPGFEHTDTYTRNKDKKFEYDGSETKIDPLKVKTEKSVNFFKWSTADDEPDTKIPEGEFFDIRGEHGYLIGGYTDSQGRADVAVGYDAKNKKFTGNADANAIAEAVVAKGDAHGSLSEIIPMDPSIADLKASVSGQARSVAQANIGLNGEISKKGAELTFNGGFEAVALQLEGNGKVGASLFGDTIQVDATGDATLNLGAVGANAEGGLTFKLDEKNRVVIGGKVGVGLSLLAGGRLKGGVKITIDTVEIAKATYDYLNTTIEYLERAWE